MDFVFEDSDEEFAKGRIGSAFAGWTLEALLGIGGMAAVYAGVDREGRRAAVKVLHPHMNRRKDIRQRFLREGTTANRIRHPGIVQVLEESSAGDGTAALVMELLEGQTFTGLLRDRGQLSASELLDYLDQVLDALGAAHQAGIVHRDLKPDNLFITREGRVKILDFGIARVLDAIPSEHLTRTGMTLGTVPFMSPEQALGKRDQVDGRTDLFALGAMAFRILTGRFIHQEDTDGGLLVAMATKPAPPLRSVAPDLSEAVTAIVDLALAFSRDARYPDARTMQLDVRAARDGKPPPYAVRHVAAREQATRVDLEAPAVAAAGVASASPGVSSPPSPTSAPTRVGPSPDAPTAHMPAPDAATRVGPSPDAPTVQMPASDARTRVAANALVAAAPNATSPAVEPLAGDQVVGLAPAPSRRFSGKGLYLAAAAGALALGGLAYALGSGPHEGAATEVPVERLPSRTQGTGKVTEPSPTVTREARPPSTSSRSSDERMRSLSSPTTKTLRETPETQREAVEETARAALHRGRDFDKEERKSKKGGKGKGR